MRKLRLGEEGEGSQEDNGVRRERDFCPQLSGAPSDSATCPLFPSRGQRDPGIPDPPTSSRLRNSMLQNVETDPRGQDDMGPRL